MSIAENMGEQLRNTILTWQNRALNDDEVVNEMNKMVLFIKQEAQEKAREIRVKADEEFAIEKARLVKQEQQAFDAQFEKKRKQAEISQKDVPRLRLLHRREEHVQDLFHITRNSVSSLSQDSDRYTKFMQDVILQGFLAIMEAEVTVYCRKQDKSAVSAYKDLSGKDISFQVDASLSDDLAGGVKLIDGSRRITVDNTLDERLRLLEDRRSERILFGINENRKFYT
ncbi:vacuolar H+ ATPase E1 [Coprinopsis sp. MPI-PUGE-AT-0042]|nr:vacuolar H+ ATPase E1 [Coprinopsis sp. MPI-PUGE-AT-0042]